MKAANTMQVRQHNKTVIRQAMLCLRQATRPQLAQKTGLSQVTVSAVLAELMEKGEVESCGSVPSEGGRPSACYRYRGEHITPECCIPIRWKGERWSSWRCSTSLATG